MKLTLLDIVQCSVTMKHCIDSEHRVGYMTAIENLSGFKDRVEFLIAFTLTRIPFLVVGV